MGRVTEKGQITIPAELRRKFNLLPNTEVEVIEKDGQVVVQPKYGGMNRGRWIAEGLRGKATNWELTADEIMALTRGDD
jgi:AbrB family looped-hinge helix DNA binding protein